MKSLYKIECIKNLYSSSFRAIILLHLLLFSLVLFSFSQFQFSFPGFSTRKFFSFPNVWETFSYVASWFNILLTILIIISVGNEYTFRTNRQQIINGLSRNDLLYQKLITVLMISVYSLIVVFVSGLIYGTIFTFEFSFEQVIEQMPVLLIYFVQTISYMVLGLLIVTVFRNTALSIVLFFVYRIILEPVIRMLFNKEFRPYFPMKSITNLTPVPEIFELSTDKNMINSDGASELSFKELGVDAVQFSVHALVVPPRLAGACTKGGP